MMASMLRNYGQLLKGSRCCMGGCSVGAVQYEKLDRRYGCGTVMTSTYKDNADKEPPTSVINSNNVRFEW